MNKDEGGPRVHARRSVGENAMIYWASKSKCKYKFMEPMHIYTDVTREPDARIRANALTSVKRPQECLRPHHAAPVFTQKRLLHTPTLTHTFINRDTHAHANGNV